MKRILITGAGSYVGVSAEQYLKQWPDSFWVDTADMHGAEWEKLDFSGYDCVFHVAGIAHADIGKLSEEEVRLYYEVNTDLAIAVAKRAKSQGVSQFIFMSTANVYGDSSPIGQNKIITRDYPLQAVNCYSDSKMKAEEQIGDLREDGFKVVVLRCPMIYGKDCRGNYCTLSRMAKKLPVFPKVKNMRSMLYIGNLTEFLRLMIQNEEDGIFCPCDREAVCTSDLVKLIAGVHGKRVILVPGLGWALKLLSHLSGKVNKAFGGFYYDASLSAYKEEYRRFTLEEAVRETELHIQEE